MHFPKELKYTKTHEWVRFTDDNTAYIGITDYAQDQLGDLVFVNLPAEGDELTAAAEKYVADHEVATVDGRSTLADFAAAAADEVVLMVSGIAAKIKQPEQKS